jgi:hypothetical protein
MFFGACGSETSNDDNQNNGNNVCNPVTGENCTECTPDCDNKECGVSDGCEGHCFGYCEKEGFECEEVFGMEGFYCDGPTCNDCPEEWFCVADDECVDYCENLRVIEGRWRNATDASRELIVSLENQRAVDGECIVSVSGEGSYYEGDVITTDLPFEITVRNSLIRTYTEGEYLIQNVTIGVEHAATIYFRR